jgi:hypothetical protein
MSEAIIWRVFTALLGILLLAGPEASARPRPTEHVRLGVLRQFNRRYDPDDIGALGLKRVFLDNRNPQGVVRCSFAADITHRYVPSGPYTFTDPHAQANAARSLAGKLDPGSIRRLGRSFSLPPGVRAILERPAYCRPEELERNLVLYDEVSRGREFDLYSGTTRVHGFSFFKRLGLLGRRERLVLVIPKVQIEGLEMGETFNTRRDRRAKTRLNLGYARVVKDMLYSGFAAALKNKAVEEIEITAWGVQNPFLRRSYERLGFDMIGERQLRSKSGAAGLGYDYSIVLRKKRR